MLTKYSEAERIKHEATAKFTELSDAKIKFEEECKSCREQIQSQKQRIQQLQGLQADAKQSARSSQADLKKKCKEITVLHPVLCASDYVSLFRICILKYPN